MKRSRLISSRSFRRPHTLWLLAAIATAFAAGSWSQSPDAPTQSAAPMTLKPVAASATGEAMAHTCAACHGTQGRLGDEAFVPLAGMPSVQFVRTMQDFRRGTRPSTLMGHVSQGFTDADLAAMAAYFESIPVHEAAR